MNCSCSVWESSVDVIAAREILKSSAKSFFGSNLFCYTSPPCAASSPPRTPPFQDISFGHTTLDCRGSPSWTTLLWLRALPLWPFPPGSRTSKVGRISCRIRYTWMHLYFLTVRLLSSACSELPWLGKVIVAVLPPANVRSLSALPSFCSRLDCCT